MIKITPKLLSLFLLLASVGTSYATSETADINLSFTHTNYVNLTGTAVGATRFFSVTDVEPVGNANKGPKVPLGTLGLASNMLGNCTFEFTSQNSFRLKHIVTNKRLSGYNLHYQNKKITRKKNEVITPTCNITPSSLEFSTKNFIKKPKAGIYRDIITVVVTTQ